MQFYKIDMTIEEKHIEVFDQSDKKIWHPIEKNWKTDFAGYCSYCNGKMANKGYCFLSNASHGKVLVGLLLGNDFGLNDFVEQYILNEESDLQIRSMSCDEITLPAWFRMLRDGEKDRYIFSAHEVLEDFELEDLCERGMNRLNCTEAIFSDRSRETIYLWAKSLFMKEPLIAELNRIYAGKPNKRAYGHPVDYMIETDDEEAKKCATQLLLQALYDVGRINSRRYCLIECNADGYLAEKQMSALYKSCVGGVIVVRVEAATETDDDVISGDSHFLEQICKNVKRHCYDVLTIFLLPRECSRLRKQIYEYASVCTFVELKDELASDGSAITYLKKRAKERCIRTNNELISCVEPGRGYLTTELDAMFDGWYSNKLKTSIYKQYRDISSAKTEIKGSKPKGNAYGELEAMIGLEAAKKMIHEALDSYKAQRLFSDKGMPVDSFCNHMIFTGNPGTAKTTVARLFARILKDNDVLSKGNIVEVGRADLIGKYVGWTAKIVKTKFNEARGGILFIDEAYSLVDGRDGLYGDEAINTIVQEMENHRDEVIVIFAGYPNEMESFLDKNPGLRSRIAHYIRFEDYTPDELCRIAGHMVAEKGMVIDDEAMHKLREIMEEAVSQLDFGNGRYVRNVIEKARMAQGSRLIHMDLEAISQDDIKTIRAEDIEVPVKTQKTVNKIGFAV